MSAGGVASNSNMNPFGRTRWIGAQRLEQVPIYEDADDYMLPMTIYSNFSCSGVSSVIFESDPKKNDYENY